VPRSKPQVGRSCAICGRKRAQHICELAGREVSLLKAARTLVDYPAGQVIFHEGQPPFALYCIVSGTVKIYKASEAGRQIIVRLLSAGELLGYRPVLANEPYAATAAAVTPTRACLITRESFYESLRASPDLCVRVLGKMAKELRISEDQWLDFASDPVRRRLARLLLLLVRGEGLPLRAGIRIPGSCTRSEMAQMIGTAPETVSRTLALMGRQRLVRVTRTGIWVVDPARLSEVAAAGA
jgi:CRP-like cAMP-binding protein